MLCSTALYLFLFHLEQLKKLQSLIHRVSPRSSSSCCRTRHNTGIELEQVTNWDRTVTFWEATPPQAESMLESAIGWHIAQSFGLSLSPSTQRESTCLSLASGTSHYLFPFSNGFLGTTLESEEKINVWETARWLCLRNSGGWIASVRSQLSERQVDAVYNLLKWSPTDVPPLTFTAN